MNNMQKKFYRYTIEQQIPECLRLNLRKITIHDVINSKSNVTKRYKKFPVQFLNNRGTSGRVTQFIYHAIYNNDIKMIRICLKRFTNETLDLASYVKPRFEDHPKYTPFRLFKGWEYLYKNKQK